MAHPHEQDVVTVRDIPATRLGAIGWMVLALVLAATGAWEWRMRSIGLVAGDLGDGKENWAVERRRVADGDHDGVLIVGGSRILFDTNFAVWKEMTGRRPVQLAVPGMTGAPVLADIADHTDFAGLVLVDFTPEQFFREGAFNPAFTGVLEEWDKFGPARRASHVIGQFASRYLAFLDDAYSLESLIDQVDIPNRAGVTGPYLAVWKLSESYDHRQTVMWRGIERNERLRDHAIRVWMSRDRPAPDDVRIGKVCADMRAAVATIRARGGEVAFIRPPSAGAYYAREQRKVPRDKSWDRLLRETGTFGIHFEDYPAMQGLHLPENSHLTREDAVRFTRAYVGVLTEHYPWLRKPDVAA